MIPDADCPYRERCRLELRRIAGYRHAGNSTQRFRGNEIRILGKLLGRLDIHQVGGWLLFLVALSPQGGLGRHDRGQLGLRRRLHGIGHEKRSHYR
jgi:hypothetical protein